MWLEGNGRSGARCKRRYASGWRTVERTCWRGRRTNGSEVGERLGERKPLEDGRLFSTTLDFRHVVAGAYSYYFGFSYNLHGSDLSCATTSSDLHCLFRRRWPFKMVLRRPKDIATWLQVSRDFLHFYIHLCLILVKLDLIE